jgi:hypothetical protein
MVYPDRRLRLMILCLVAFVAAVAGVNWIANPYGAWGASLIDKIYLKMEVGRERIATPYRLRVEQPRTLLVGSSRVLYGMTIEQGYREGVLNAGLPAATLEEIDAVVRIATHSPVLEHIIWGVDFYTFGRRFATASDPLTLQRFESNKRLLIMETLLNMEALEASRKVLFRRIGGRRILPPSRVLPLPWPEDIVREYLGRGEQMDWDWTVKLPLQPNLAGWLSHYSSFRLSPNQMALFRKTVARAREAGVRVTLFIPLLGEYELEIIRQVGEWDTYQHWKRQILEAGPYWDFSGYSELARTDKLFTNVAHFAPAVGHVILRHLMGEGCEGCGPIAREIIAAGSWVEAANLDEHLARQDAEMRRRTKMGSPYARAVENVIRSEATPGGPRKVESSVAPALQPWIRDPEDDGRETPCMFLP